MNAPRTVSILTNGCSEGIKYSNVMKRFCLRNGLCATDNYEVADVISLYACGLTQERRESSIRLIQKLMDHKKKGCELIVWGCLPKIDPNLILGLGQKTIIGPLDVGYFDRMVSEKQIPVSHIEQSFGSDILWEDTLLSEHRATEDLFSRSIRVNRFIDDRILALARLTLLAPFLNRISTDLFEKGLKSRLARKLIRTRPATKRGALYISIATGCTHRCTYCTEKQAFGSLKSREEETILDEFECGLKNGYRHFSLMATDLSAYGSDKGSSLSELLGRMLELGAGKNFGIFLNQAEPSGLLECFGDLKPLLASKKISGLNCPVQSGSNRMLKLMGRQYTANEWREAMLEMQGISPGMRITTHLLVGFPSESSDDVEMTVKLFDRPLIVHAVRVFKYNENERLPASRIPGKVPDDVKVQRCSDIRRRYAKAFAANMFRSPLAGLRQSFRA